MRFSSKKDNLLAVIIWGTILFMLSLLFIEKDLIVYIICIPMIILLLWIWFGTSYHIDGNVLKIKSGPFRSKIEIDEISKIRARKTLLSAPALSMDRMEITYNKYDLAIISPSSQGEFIQLLLEKNKYIIVDQEILEEK